jgi:hypothetical protein
MAVSVSDALFTARSFFKLCLRLLGPRVWHFALRAPHLTSLKDNLGRINAITVSVAGSSACQIEMLIETFEGGTPKHDDLRFPFGLEVLVET